MANTDWDSMTETELRTLKREMNDNIAAAREEVLALSAVIDRKQQERYAEAARIAAESPEAVSAEIDGAAATADMEAKTP